MPPPTQLAAAQLRQMIYYNLDNEFNQNALFLAGRVHAIDTRNTESIHLLGLCHYRLGQFREAMDVCRGAALRGAHLGCSYIFAQACLGAGKYHEGISNLEKIKGLWTDKKHSTKDQQVQRLPDTAAVWFLLAQLYEKDLDPKRAVESYAEALKLNPFMWVAFERLCHLGATIRPENAFKSNSDLMDMLSQFMDKSLSLDKDPSAADFRPSQNHTASHVALHSSNGDPFSTREAGLSVGAGNRNNIAASHDPESPPLSERTMEHHNLNIAAVPNAPIRRTRPTGNTAGHHSSFGDINLSWNRSKARPNQEDIQEAQESKKSSSAMLQPSLQTKRTLSGTTTAQQLHQGPQETNLAPQQRRSTRLFKSTVKPAPIQSKEPPDSRQLKTAATRARTANTATVGRVVSGNRKPIEQPVQMLKELKPIVAEQHPIIDTERHPSHQISRTAEMLESVNLLMSLMTQIGHGYYALCSYRCEDALQSFLELPSQQRETPWVLSQIARSYYELGNYAESEKSFTKLRKLAPGRMQDLETMSTLLWHLRREVDLGFLAQELMEISRLSPEAWCALGNSFSLERKHDQALKCFKRASQLDPNFAYAFTLQGHEHFANEELDKALSSYRKAVASDHRHYNGWYGLAKVFEKQGKFAEASEHYMKASSINPNNAVLICCKGTMLEKLKNPQLALREYELACEISPKSSIARYRKAHMLYIMGSLQEALKDLLMLRDLCPDEPRVHLLLAKTYKKMQDKRNALQHFTIAMNLDPKAMQQMKDEIETMDEVDYVDEEDDEDMME